VENIIPLTVILAIAHFPVEIFPVSVKLASIPLAVFWFVSLPALLGFLAHQNRGNNYTLKQAYALSRMYSWSCLSLMWTCCWQSAIALVGTWAVILLSTFLLNGEATPLSSSVISYIAPIIMAPFFIWLTFSILEVMQTDADAHDARGLGWAKMLNASNRIATIGLYLFWVVSRYPELGLRSIPLAHFVYSVGIDITWLSLIVIVWSTLATSAVFGKPGR
jgi:hypothetical protein